MKRFIGALCFLVAASLLPLAAPAQEVPVRLPKGVYPDSRNRLPLINGSPDSLQGAAAIRLHGSQGAVRWQSGVGRELTELAILTAAREHDQPYEWSLHEMEAIAVGQNPAVIDVVRYRKPLTGVGEKESAIIQIGREVFRTHNLSSETYAAALKLFGERDLVDVVDLMASYAATAARLNAVNQQLPPGWKQFLPLSFTPPDDIHPDSRSRLPLVQSAPQMPAAAPALYSRNLAPEGTGPAHIRRHGAGLKSLESSVGRRLMALAILVTARAHDAQYEWTMTEPTALKDGLEPAIIDQVRHHKAPTGLAERDATLVEFGRELFGKHSITSQTYARALKVFGERDLVDIVDLMAQHTADGVLFTVFDQQLPAGQKPLLPIP
jgi:alkylhydroperoxidase family enzyme